jgi:hypothetical protein
MVTQRQNPAYRLAHESPAAQLTAGLSLCVIVSSLSAIMMP